MRKYGRHTLADQDRKGIPLFENELGLRPVCHQLEYRSDSHMFVSVLAYRILHTIETRLRMHGDHRTWDTIREILSTHQRLTIEYNFTEGKTMRHGHII
ncbi:MAG: hypothetical protein GY749_31865 [Desulfobacteraceae bacterium]|nr:hypothetical protein [Desulfobacteraceae bacterium]